MNTHASSPERDSFFSHEAVIQLLAEGDYTRMQIEDFLRYLSDERTKGETVQRLNRATGEKLDAPIWKELLGRVNEMKVDRAA